MVETSRPGGERPELTFACELPPDALVTLFADDRVLAQLSMLQARVSLGILDLSPERAAVVRRLNEAGIPVVAWLLLPESEGYWFNADNGPQAVGRYAAFRAWTAENDLVWDGVGIDMEPALDEVRMLLGGRLLRLLPRWLHRVVDGERVRRAQAIYRTLVIQMQLDGYCVESYQFPFIVDERQVGSTLLQRLFGLVDVAPDREVLMLYSSFFRPVGAGLVWSYADEAAGIGVGSTGGGVEAGVEALPLSWSEFARDLRLASLYSDALFVFSLEGCVEQGFLERLTDFDWAEPVPMPFVPARRVALARRLLRSLLWMSARPILLLSALAGLLVLGRLRVRRRRR